MPMFFFGALLAQHWAHVRQAFGFLTHGGLWTHIAGALLVVVAVCGMTSFFMFGRLAAQLGLDQRLSTMPLVLAGILLLTIVSVQWPPLSRLLTARGMVFLGTISFSLYLVHRPIMIAVGFATGVGTVPALLTIATSFAVAIGFYYAFERPIHRLARRLNSSIQRREAAETAPASA